jgi:hypothetical protein
LNVNALLGSGRPARRSQASYQEAGSFPAAFAFRTASS